MGKFQMKILILIFMFFMFSALLIISNENLAFYNFDNILEFNSIYSDWVGGFFSNIKSVTGYAVKLEWFPSSNI